jgi:hypothetical protein
VLFALATALAATGCAPEHACSLIAIDASVTVDVGFVGIAPETTTARLCLDDECTDLPVEALDPEPGSGQAAQPEVPASVRWRRDIPRRDEVTVTLDLTDRATGAPLYHGEGRAVPDVLEPNGPGCGEAVALPTLTASTAGTLTTS